MTEPASYTKQADGGLLWHNVRAELRGYSNVRLSVDLDTGRITDHSDPPLAWIPLGVPPYEPTDPQPARCGGSEA